MNVAKAYTPREASILCAYGEHSDMFASDVGTTLNPTRAILRPATITRQRKVYFAYDNGVSTKSKLEDHVISALLTDNSHSNTSWTGLSSRFYESIIGLASLSASGTSEELTKTEAALWYFELKYLSAHNKTREALDHLFNCVEDAFDIADFHKLDCMLRQVNAKELPPEMLVSVLRATSRAKETLSSWYSLLSHTKSLFEQKHMPSRMLRGL